MRGMGFTLHVPDRPEPIEFPDDHTYSMMENGCLIVKGKAEGTTTVYSQIGWVRLETRKDRRR